MTVEYRIISIGALSRHRLWGETAPVRTAHATTTLVTEDERLILVDPSLPGPVLAAKLNERTGKTLADVTDVFCTTLRMVHRRSIEAIPQADWWAGELEIASYARHLAELQDSADRLGGEDAAAVEAELRLLERFRPAPERFGRQVSLYPLTGPSIGSAGLLLTPATATIVVAGDAALTREHIDAGRVWQGSADAEAAMTSLRDLLELADVIVPGHDNVMLSPARWL